jgi:cytochrome c553
MPYHSYHPGFATVILFALLQGTTVVAAESSNPLADAKPELMQVCAGCHGADGVAASEEYPSLGGQNEAYLIQALKDFRDGKRPSAIMRGIARELREEDVRTLARHYAAKPYQRKPQSIDADRISRGSEVYQRLCQICHLDEGRNTTYAESICASLSCHSCCTHTAKASRVAASPA